MLVMFLGHVVTFFTSFVI